MNDKELAGAFFDRFLGLQRAYGEYRLPDVIKSSKGQKIKGSAQTLREQLTETEWRAHLDGSVGLGIIPINDDAEVRFGAIDIDESGIDLKKEKEVSAMDLPLIVCRSKSGGAHLYLFCSEPVSAQVVRGKLGEWAVALGYSGVEVFPKQIRLANDRDVGNWINMPYFKHEDTNRYAIAEGKQLKAIQFLELAEALALDEETLVHTSPPHDESLTDLFDGAPPCIQTLARRGFGEGSRNNGLFAIGIYLRKRYGDDDWEQRLDEYNQEFFHPPLGHREVATVVRGVKRKNYEYKCTEPPIANVCNKQICVTREFGVGQGDKDPGVVIGALTKICTEPPMWILDVDGERIELTTEELKSQPKFHNRCIDLLNKWPNIIKTSTWVKLIRDRLASAEIVEMPEDATAEGKLWYYLEIYLTERPPARSRDELLQDKPWTDKGLTYFSGPHFHGFLERERFRIKDRELWAWLKKRGVGTKGINIRGKYRNYRYVEAFKTQVSEFDVPALENMEEL